MRTVALLGATGYTGRLVAAELARRGVPHRLGGRSAQRLEAVPSPAERHVVDLADAASLDRFLDGADALLTCVGPFAQHGMPVVEAAVRTGTSYVDSTGEPAFMSDVYARFRDAEAPLVPACGFDYVPGDLAAAVAVAELGTAPDEVRVLYRIRSGAVSRGTARSALGAMGSARVRPRRLVLQGPDGPVTGVEVPWGEQVTVPLHVPGARVRTAVGAGELVSRASSVVGPVVPLLQPLSRLAQPLLERAVDRLPEGPPADRRAQAEALVLADARSGDRAARVAVRCRDAYGLTARLLVEAALTVGGRGAQAPAEALDARTFLDAVSGEREDGAFSWEVL